MRKTKIICTLGPSTDSPEILEAMMKSGMDVARFNFSHGTHEDHKRRLEMLKDLRKKLNIPVDGVCLFHGLPPPQPTPGSTRR